MPALSVLMKPSSGNCNMYCDYCFYCDEMVKRKQQSFGFMSEETLKNVIRKTLPRAEGMICYAYQGGEPLLRGIDFYRKALQFQARYNRQGIRVDNALQTNGFLLNEEWAQFFKENNFLIGVSVDGTRATHNTYRHKAGGGDTYDVIAKNIEILDRYGVEYNILSVVTENLARHVDEIYQDFKDHGWKYQQYIDCLDPLGEPVGSRPYSLRPDTFGRFMTRLFDLWYEDWKQGQQPYIRKLENYIGILAGYCPESCEQRGICGIQVVVEADGGVYPCDFYMLDEFYLGNFNTDRMDQIDQRRLETGFIQRSTQISAECKACPYYHICRGGCHRTKVFDQPGNGFISQYCRGYRYFFDHCIDRMQEIAKTVR